METSEKALSDALRLLGKGVRDETIAFEASIHGAPFLPRQPEESARIFQDHCKRLNDYFDDQTLKHYCWMALPKSDEHYTFFLRFENGVAIPERHPGTVEHLLTERVIPLAAEGHVWGKQSFGTPQLVRGPKLVASYVILEGGPFEKLLKTSPTRAQVMDYCQSLPNGWPADAILCDAFFVRRASDKKDLIEALSPSMSDRVRFEAYHIIAGLSVKHFEALAQRPYVREVLKLSTMQFQREWGNLDQQNHAERKLQEAQISSFDQVTHSSLNALRSIGAGLACQDFADGTPPIALSHRLVKRTQALDTVDGVTFDAEGEKLLLDTLSRLWVGEEATAGALSFGRLLAHRKILAAMTAREPVDVVVLVERAAALLKSYVKGTKPQKAYSLDCSRVRKGEGMIPKGYLGKESLSVLVYELLLNAYHHAALPIEISIDVSGGDDHVCLFVRSRLQAGSQWVQTGRIALPPAKASNPKRRSFLMRFADIETVLKHGLTITSRISEDGEWYEVEVCMRKLETEHGEFVHPRWERSA